WRRRARSPYTLRTTLCAPAKETCRQPPNERCPMGSTLRTCCCLAVALTVSLTACSGTDPLQPAARPSGLSPAMLLQETSLQATPPGYIRIGVVPSATSVEIGAAG